MATYSLLLKEIVALISASVTPLIQKNGMNMAKKKIKRRAWTKEDIRELKALARQKVPAPKIARRFKRTEGAIRQKALALRISLDSRAT